MSHAFRSSEEAAHFAFFRIAEISNAQALLILGILRDIGFVSLIYHSQQCNTTKKKNRLLRQTEHMIISQKDKLDCILTAYSAKQKVHFL